MGLNTQSRTLLLCKTHKLGYSNRLNTFTFEKLLKPWMWWVRIAFKPQPAESELDVPYVPAAWSQPVTTSAGRNRSQRNHYMDPHPKEKDILVQSIRTSTEAFTLGAQFRLAWAVPIDSGESEVLPGGLGSRVALEGAILCPRAVYMGIHCSLFLPGFSLRCFSYKH